MKPLVVLATFGVILAACGSEGGAPSQATATVSAAATASATAAATSTPSAISSGTTVQAVNFAFQPQTLSVKAGTSVSFQNGDSTTHTFTADGGAFNSGRVAPGNSFRFTFSSAGSFPYHCTIHPFMTGTINVTS